jgi:penicillin-binding protein 1A
MYELDMIDAVVFNEALSAPITASRHDPPVLVDAPYIGEMVRQEIIAKYSEQQAYEGGLQVFTTVLAERQNFASRSLRKGLLEYDRRHGYRGPESRLTLEQTSNLDDLRARLTAYSTVGSLIPGIVQSVDETQATVVTQEQVLSLGLDAIKWARPYISENAMGKTPAKVSEVLSSGDVIRLIQTSEGHWQLTQLPQVTGALVSLNPQDGAIEALVGGFDFYQSNFNRAVQARRQPGSSFKPFIYSAALEHGFTPATIINDAPVVFEDRSIEDVWRPQNYSGQFFGPTRLRQALTKSRNMVSIRVLRDIGRSVAIEHIAKFGFDVERMPRDLTLALGSAEVTPLELATAYTLFANRGFRIEPYLIDRVMGPGGEELYKANPARACDRACQSLIAELDEHEAEFSELGLGPVHTDGVEGYHISPRMVDEANIYLMDSMMKDVIRFGTAVKAKVLDRNDIAGKTGTTNQQKDAWFSGYQPTLVTTVWVGFDAHKPLGRQEVGGVAALPIWIDYMRSALQGVPESIPPLPEGMVVLKIDPESGLLVDQQSGYGIEEIFKVDQVPALGATFNRAPAGGGRSRSGSAQISNLPEQLF